MTEVAGAAFSEREVTSESSGRNRSDAWVLRCAPAAVVLATCLGICSGAIASSDTWWHLATGRWIFQHGAVPHQDPFSFTLAGKHWVAHEYLTELGMYILHRVGGFALLSVVNALLLMLAFWFVYLRCKGRVWVNVAVVLLAAWAALPSFAIRPQSITLLFGGLTLWIIDRYLWYSERGQERVGRRVLFLLPILTLLWAQMHGGFLLGVGEGEERDGITALMIQRFLPMASLAGVGFGSKGADHRFEINQELRDRKSFLRMLPQPCLL